MIHDDRDCNRCSPEPTATTSETYLGAASLLVRGVMGLGFALGWW